MTSLHIIIMVLVVVMTSCRPVASFLLRRCQPRRPLGGAAALGNNELLLRNRGRLMRNASSDANRDGVEISPLNHGTAPLTSLMDAVVGDGRLKKYLKTNDLTRPTPIQAHSIPLLRQGYDVMASAQTGSGKTLMFALPLCQALMKESQQSSSAKTIKKKPAAILLNPTRELAMQTHDVVKELTRQSHLRTGLAVGGMQGTRDKLQQCDILVATPGRLLQHVDERVISLRQTQYVVIDEGDRMLDLGFEPQLRRIARALGRQQDSRQTILCSATFPPAVQRLAADFLRPDYYFVAAGKVGGMHSRIQQELIWLGQGENRESVVTNQVNAFLKQNTKSSVIVFCGTKEGAEEIGKRFGKRCKVVTGDKTQKERNQSLQLFRQGRVPLLVATDVAARGLHVENVGLVVQADAPREADTFVHRIGRTGRAGATGQAVAVLDGRSVGIAADLVDLLRDANQSVPAWLIGMAYVSRAKQMEEEEAIAAGGGAAASMSSALTQQESKEDADQQSTGAFSSQDFRKDAEAGTWGIGRDTTYHDFDEEAYRSFEHVSLDDFDQVKANSDQDQSGHGRSSAQLAEADFIGLSKQSPSKELRNRLRKETDREHVGAKPDRRFYQLLSKDRDQKLKFEYLGMFPFSEVLSLLNQGYAERDTTDRSSHLPTVLMVAEKPSIAKAVADALSDSKGPRQRKGISRALPVYEFTTKNFFPEQNRLCRIKVTSVVGHVFSLGFIEDDREKKGGFTDPSEFYNLPVAKKEEVSTGKLRVVDHLRALAADSDHLVLWLDCDAEGENIAHEVIGVTRKAFEARVARDIRDSDTVEAVRRIHRARFSAITKDALRRAFTGLEEPDAALSRSVDARQELDLRVGVSMTRLLNWRCIGLARKYFSPATKLVSYGPCQTPALSFCVERAREIETFRSKPYHKVEVTCVLQGKSNGTFFPKWIVPLDEHENSDQAEFSDSLRAEHATFDKALADKTAGTVLGANRLKVLDVKELHETKNAPLGLNTVALLTSASKAMGMSPKQVMNVAEKLYSSGFISYPRTETTRYDPTGFDVRSTLREHQSHPEWGRTASFLLRTKYASSGRPPLRGHDAGDHPPITPLKAASRDEVGGGNQWRVFDFITRNFLGSLSDDLQYTRRVAELGVDGNNNPKGPRFELEQVHVDSLGFAGACRWVLNDIGAAPKTDDGSALVFRQGLDFLVKGAQSVRGQTKPPRFLQEHELVQLMDKNGIGTDASMATHINNIVDRGYVVLCDETGVPLRPFRPPRPGQPRPARQIGRYMVPTSLGMSVIELFENVATKSSEVSGDTSLELLARPAIRAQMEAEVKQIASGEMSKEECLANNLAWFEARYHELFNALSKQRVDEFGRSLCQTKDSLKHWRNLRAFVGADSGAPTSTRSNTKKPKGMQKPKRPGTKSAKRHVRSRQYSRKQ